MFHRKRKQSELPPPSPPPAPAPPRPARTAMAAPPPADDDFLLPGEGPRQQDAGQPRLPRLDGPQLPAFDERLPPAEPLPVPAFPASAKAGARGRRASPPLFIKLDRYHDITATIEKLKAQALHLRDAVDAMTELQKELALGFDLSAQSLDRFSEIITALDSKLVRFGQAELEPLPPESEDEDLEAYIRGVYAQLEKVRSELQAPKVRKRAP